MPYQAICKENQLICGDGKIVVITGWTPKEKVAKLLKKEDYAVIGNLYSANRGLDFLIRNLLANPQYNKLLILNCTKEDQNSGATTTLINFLNKGSDIEENKFEEIDLINLRLNTVFEVVNNIKDLVDTLEILKNRNKVSKLKAKHYPIEEKEVKILPSNIYSHTVEGNTIAETWVKIIHQIKNYGIIEKTGYGGCLQELINLVAIVKNEPEGFYFPEPNYLPVDKSFIENYLPQMIENKEYKDGIKYTYGQRLRSWFGKDQVEQVIKKLIEEKECRSAVMNLWDSGSGSPVSTDYIDYQDNSNSFSVSSIERFGRSLGDSDHDHGGSPCLNHIQVRILDDRLILTALFRSNDMFSAWTSNAMGLRALQEHICYKINSKTNYGLRLGNLITISESAHIYDDCWENAENLINEQYRKIIHKENNTYEDPCGNFIVTVEENKYVMEHLSSTGEFLQKFENKNKHKLILDLLEKVPTIQRTNLVYIMEKLN